ncbi:MAG: 30S ribosomal protein S17 [Candidatus Spechtbacteria bacterium RIFCSPLOWO2_12_FULL_38_22]|uniref:Small ribosomal subunit protein uS17 n=1 Tax=Candidatus Spechtbacteria bacterium RIFCSPLOWO2_12_FULL_38_22 TaxID=1802165 RepID=A0A1G2HIW9_9BACT|nr:MAG: 30S ribosomal protein S17 [Candidatus Spechtbacteria bacterium RIFCSPHIGHO2_01_FULL_38_11]OGZ59298.1 MAG: 30S ribosomal protein S17 [Candidatus Spechtbacteria bacterium RIFCSPHIGHO2_12_FULL_38_30]OGZ60478.1 MAG: 30S ribosomal protein S17 [Candidatus Spechtbacteria bacterium RIFCSPLOWO2_01_FULL_38_20]OGZ62171.1 MAG: 30S ribosomal protein S17 [Candidatus Spechtbacteria bacterium RIFCSPLOWO2_12_FULL_38_22]
MEKNNKQKNPKRMRGKVVSNKMQKTLVVAVDRLVAHPKYKKRKTVSKRYKVHYDSGVFNIDDVVNIEETRPLSKDKRWKIIK